MIKNFLRGIVVGIASILPGVSGGTMLVAMGIYDKLIHCINHILDVSRWKEYVKFLLPIVVGAGVALVGLSFLIEPAFAHFPLQTNCMFIGLILGGLPAIVSKLRDEQGRVRVKVGYVIPFLIFFTFVVVSAAAGDVQGKSVDMSFDLVNCLKLFGVGILASATMVIPGVSGSMILLLLGYYNPIVETINVFIRAVLTLDKTGVFVTCFVLIPLGLGLVFGVFAVAKVVEVVLSRFPFHAYWAILGLVVSSPIGILLVGEVGQLSALNVLTSAAILCAGVYAALKLGD